PPVRWEKESPSQLREGAGEGEFLRLFISVCSCCRGAFLGVRVIFRHEEGNEDQYAHDYGHEREGIVERKQVRLVQQLAIHAAHGEVGGEGGGVAGACDGGGGAGRRIGLAAAGGGERAGEVVLARLLAAREIAGEDGDADAAAQVARHRIDGGGLA